MAASGASAVSNLPVIEYALPIQPYATSASLVIQVRNNTGVISTGTYDLKASGAIMGFVQMSNLPNIEQFPLLGDLQITAQVTEVGGATVGGPWKLAVRFVR